MAEAINRWKFVVTLAALMFAPWPASATGSGHSEAGSGEVGPATLADASVLDDRAEENVQASPVDGLESRPRRRSIRFAAQKTASVPWYRNGLGSLAIVLAAIALAYYLLRRWMPSTKARETGLLRVVARTHLTAKQHAALIQLGRRFVLVGVSPDRLTILTEIRDADEVAELAARSGARSIQAFDEQLMDEATLYEGMKDEPASRHAVGKHGEPVKDLLAKLRKLRVP